MILELLVWALMLPIQAVAVGTVSEERCGWVESSGSAYVLVDGESQWLLAAKGGHEAEGIEKLPPLTLSVPGGEGAAACACLDLVINYSAHWVEEISGARALPASSCRKNKSLPERNWIESASPPQTPTEPARSPRERDKKKPDPERPQERGQEGKQERGQQDEEQDQEKGDQEDGGQHDGGQGLPAFGAEIQIFLDYQGYNNYRMKLVSGDEWLFSAAWIYPAESTRRNAVCFKGDPEGALRLVEAMVEKMNHENGMAVQVFGSVYLGTHRSGKPALRLEAEDRYGSFLWFERLRECDRWSTEKERRNGR